MPQSTILAVSLFFHLLATAVWIGGLIVTAILVSPVARNALDQAPTMHHFLNRFRKRFTPFANLSLVVLIATGLTQMAFDPNYNGLMDFSNTWSQVILLKHIVIVGMVGVGIMLQYVVAPSLERTTLLLQRSRGTEQDEAELARLRRRETRLTWINTALGVLVLGFSAWAGTL